MEMTLDTIGPNELGISEETKRSESEQKSVQNQSNQSSQMVKMCLPVQIERPLSMIDLI